MHGKKLLRRNKFYTSWSAFRFFFVFGKYQLFYDCFYFFYLDFFYFYTLLSLKPNHTQNGLFKNMLLFMQEQYSKPLILMLFAIARKKCFSEKTVYLKFPAAEAYLRLPKHPRWSCCDIN